MSLYKILVPQKIRPVALAKLKERCEVRYWDDSSPAWREQLFELLREAEGLISSGAVKIDDELLAHAPRLRVISQASVGYDNVDVEACIRKGIPFCNTPGVLVETTADLTFGLLLSAARRIHEGWLQVRDGRWLNSHDVPFGVDLFGKTLGIVGMGDIGSAVAKRAKASGMKVIYHNRRRRSHEAAIGATYADFDELLAESDFIVVLVPLTRETKGLFGKEQFSKMKPTAHFINVSRGSVVDTDALVNALKNGQLAYAALDVTDPEPLPTDHPLLSLSNILITPHIGSATNETRDRMALLAADNLLAGLEGRALLTPVNLPADFHLQ